MPTLDWRIYYTDLSTFDSAQGAPEDAPSRGVAAIVIADEEIGRTIIHKWDFYYWNLADREWCGCDQWGLIDHLLDNRVSAFKMGRTMEARAWKELLSRATNDPDFPVKSARRAFEAPEMVRG